MSGSEAVGIIVGLATIGGLCGFIPRLMGLTYARRELVPALLLLLGPGALALAIVYTTLVLFTDYTFAGLVFVGELVPFVAAWVVMFLFPNPAE